MTEADSLAAYLAFRAEFEAWHFRSEGSTHAATQPDSVPGSVLTEVDDAPRTDA